MGSNLPSLPCSRCTTRAQTASTPSGESGETPRDAIASAATTAASLPSVNRCQPNAAPAARVASRTTSAAASWVAATTRTRSALARAHSQSRARSSRAAAPADVAISLTEHSLPQGSDIARTPSSGDTSSMFFPLRVEEATVDRLPVVSIGIAALCALAFALTWIVPANPTGVRGEQVRDIVRYYGEHPYLNLPDSFARDYLNERAADRLSDLHQDPPASLDALTLQMEQRHLDSMLDGFEAEASASALRRFALVPARGILQPGWLTAMFLHFGWMHILGNLFFFYLVGPLLEDLWGRAFFAGFYLFGGLVAAMAHFGMDPHSAVPMAGASGAIAACMGAFTWRCAARKIRMAYWFGWFIRGTFLLPAWAWGGIWFALEVLSFALHAPAVQARTVWTQHQGTDAARAALDTGDKVAAAAAYRQVLEERPLDRE